MVQAENKSEHKPPPIEQTSPIRNTPEKLYSVLQYRTLGDITQFLDSYKRNQSETPITTLTHLKHCYDRNTNSYNHSI